MIWIAALLFLHPIVGEDTDVRIVATGTEDAMVTWRLDGQPIATTVDGKAGLITLPAGEHELSASAATSQPWDIMARPQPSGNGAMYVHAWTAKFSGEARPAAAALPVSSAEPIWSYVALAAGAVALLVLPRFRHRATPPGQSAQSHAPGDAEPMPDGATIGPDASSVSNSAASGGADEEFIAAHPKPLPAAAAGEAPMNDALLAQVCTSTPGASRNTKTMPNSRKRSESLRSAPKSGAPSNRPTCSCDGVWYLGTETSNASKTPFGGTTNGP